MIAEVTLPRTTAMNEGLHQRSLGLHGMHEVVTCPLMQ
jgi:hypothetical protein